MVSTSVDLVRAGELSIPKGIIQIVADSTGYDQDKNTFVCTGHAIAAIGGQNSRLEADTISYDQARETIDARGNVKILRNGQLTTGSSFRFKASSDEYLVTNPDVKVDGVQINVRTANGVTEGSIIKRSSIVEPDVKPLAASSQIPFISGINFRTSAGAMQDNRTLVTSNPDLARLYGTAITIKKFQPSAMSLFVMPQFAQYRLGGYFEPGVRGFRSLTDLCSGNQMLMGTLELRRKLHIPGDNAVSRMTHSQLKRTGWLVFGALADDQAPRLNLDTRIRWIDYGLPVMGHATVRHGQCVMGDFPKHAVGMRDGRPVSELPCIQPTSQTGIYPHTEQSWTY